jgi:hypothetical protein
MTRGSVVFILTILAGIVGWTVIYIRLGGPYPPYGELAWMFRWRSLVGVVVGILFGATVYLAAQRLP